jgi:nucleotide-binding universal stress UspA family protein
VIFSHLIVPLDGSQLAEAALPVAAHLAQILDARVTLLHVIERGAPRRSMVSATWRISMRPKPTSIRWLLGLFPPRPWLSGTSMPTKSAT